MVSWAPVEHTPPQARLSKLAALLVAVASTAAAFAGLLLANALADFYGGRWFETWVLFNVVFLTYRELSGTPQLDLDGG